jgi:hypothetical protein
MWLSLRLLSDPMRWRRDGDDCMGYGVRA